MTEYAGILVIFYGYCFSLLLSYWCSACLKNYLHGAKSLCVFILEYIYCHSSFFLHYGGCCSMLIMLLLRTTSILSGFVKKASVIIMNKKVYIKKWNFRKICRVF